MTVGTPEIQLQAPPEPYPKKSLKIIDQFGCVPPIDTTWEITNTQVTSSLLLAPFQYYTQSHLHVQAGEGSDHITVIDTHTGFTQVDAGAGIDFVDILSTHGDTDIYGQDGADKITAMSGTSLVSLPILRLIGGKGSGDQGDIYTIWTVGYANSLAYVGDQIPLEAGGDQLFIMGTDLGDDYLIRPNFVAALHPADVNECYLGTATLCDPNADCKNLEPFQGGYQCTCKVGFSDISVNTDGSLCIPIGACSLDNMACKGGIDKSTGLTWEGCDPAQGHPVGDCYCQQVSFRCLSCDASLGFIANLANTGCASRCESSADCVSPAYCASSHTCETCPEGKIPNAAKTDCEWVPLVCKPAGVAVLDAESNTCGCPAGYELDSTLTICVDIDECARYGCQLPATCAQGSPNTRTCSCNVEGYEFVNPPEILIGALPFSGCVGKGACGARPSDCVKIAPNSICDLNTGDCIPCSGVGEIPNGDFTACRQPCEVATSDLSNCAAGEICVDNSPNTDTCEPCPTDFAASADRLSCYDTVPCVPGFCDEIPNSICDDLPGANDCKCISGHQKVGNVCIRGVAAGGSYERYNTINLPSIVIQGMAGNDNFYFDDNSGVVQANGMAGDDNFFIGQLFNGDRNFAHITLPTDRLQTTQTTVGYLSNGCSFPIICFGGAGSDVFYALRNAATTILSGGPGNDLFIVRAFALFKQKDAVGSDSKQNKVATSGAGGNDQVNYAINAPIDASGGPGYDIIIVIGTEFGDRFVLTSDGLFGAGLFLAFRGMEEVRLLAAEGNDIINIMSTNALVITRVYGGKGSDRFVVTPRKPQTVTSWNPRGHTGLISHVVKSGPEDYLIMLTYQTAVSILDVDRPQIQVRDSGNNILFETPDTDRFHNFVYTYTASKPSKFCTTGSPPEVMVNIVLPVPDFGDPWEEYAFVSDPGSPPRKRDIHTPIAELFTCDNWNDIRQVKVNAVDHTGDGGNNQLFTAHAVWHKDAADIKYDYHGVLARSVPFNIVDKNSFDFTVYMDDGKLNVHEGAIPQGFSDNFEVFVRPCIPGVETLTFKINMFGGDQVDIKPDYRNVVFTVDNHCHVLFTVTAKPDGVVEGWHFVDIELVLQSPIAPCTMSGTCRGHGYCDEFSKCVCDATYAGHNCEFTRADCNLRGTPITNDGVPAGFSCECDTGYFGERCKDCDAGNYYVGTYPRRCLPCDPTECGVGSCNINNVAGFGLCQCATGWVGDKCDICNDEYYPKYPGFPADAKNFCKTKCTPSKTCVGYHSCDANGACVCAPNHLGPTCDTCAAGYVMKLNQVNIQTCVYYNACQNGGSVNTALTGPLCTCVGNWQGMHCDTCKPNYFGPACDIYDATPPDSCLQKGTLAGGKTCICAPHYLGPTCRVCESAAGFISSTSSSGDDNINLGESCAECVAAVTCNGHGACKYPVEAEDDPCICDPGFVPPNCVCVAATTCSGHGWCGVDGH